MSVKNALQPERTKVLSACNVKKYYLAFQMLKTATYTMRFAQGINGCSAPESHKHQYPTYKTLLKPN